MGHFFPHTMGEKLRVCPGKGEKTEGGGQKTGQGLLPTSACFGGGKTSVMCDFKNKSRPVGVCVCVKNVGFCLEKGK